MTVSTETLSYIAGPGGVEPARLAAALAEAPEGWAEGLCSRAAAELRQLDAAVGRARGVLADADLTPEARRRRGAELVAPAAARALAVAEGEATSLRPAGEEAERRALAGLLGEASTAAGEVARQASLDRCLAHLRSLGPADRVAFVLERARGGDGLPLAALAAPGAYAEALVPAEVASRARRELLAAARPSDLRIAEEARRKVAACEELAAAVAVRVARATREVGPLHLAGAA